MSTEALEESIRLSFAFGSLQANSDLTPHLQGFAETETCFFCTNDSAYGLCLLAQARDGAPVRESQRVSQRASQRWGTGSRGEPGGHRGLPPPVSETGTASTADAAEVMQARLKQVRMHGVVIHACSAFIVRVLAL